MLSLYSITLPMQVLDRPTQDFFYDAIIIGAGGGGMSLLFALHHSGFLKNNRVLVIEPDAKTSNDRTWCFWAQESDPIVRLWSPVISNQWDSVIVEGKRKSITPYHYYHIRSADIYAFVKNAVSPYENLHWISGHAGNVSDGKESGYKEVILDNDTISASYVFDSRLDTNQIEALSSEGVVWQSFVGWRVKLDSPIDDSKSIRLMDFNIPQDAYTQFVYVLPTDYNEALVEVTRFGTERISPDHANSILGEWLRLHTKNFEVLETEMGSIPMHMELNPASQYHAPETRHIRIGTAAGAVKATTGYAIHNMFKHAISISESLENSNSTFPTPFHKKRFNFYDRLLLYILVNLPNWGKPIFQQLFQKVSPTKVLAFLDEKTNLWHEIPLLMSLPFKPFIKALFATYFKPNNIKNDCEHYPLKLSFLLPLVIAFVALGLFWWSPQVLDLVTPGVLVLGLIFPGIPHGALDHCLSPAGKMQGSRLLKFILAYLGIMAGIILLWYFSPLLGVLSFIVYSAWHFGETDLRHWGVFSPTRVWFYGSSLLLFILGTHWDETMQYLLALGIETNLAYLQSFKGIIIAFSLLFIVGAGLYTNSRSRYSWLQTIAILVIGSFLPLIPAFGLYFIGLHSVRGWTHLKRGLNISSINLMKHALPFSMGAYVVFIFLFILIGQTEFNIEGLIPVIFVFLAAISGPHILLMHRFYEQPK